MNLFGRIFFAAILAGLTAGCAMAAVQQWKVAPLITAAEAYELVVPHAQPAAEDDEHQQPQAQEPVAADWAPQEGAERIGYTVLADLLVSMGFGLVLLAVSVLSGLPLTARNGLLWGLGGFFAFHLAPAFSLPPELPGMPGADLLARQVWWWATVLLTGGGLLLVGRYRNGLAMGGAAVMALVPQVIGAPPSPDVPSAVPAELATAFAASSLMAAAVFWLILGPLAGHLLERSGRAEAQLPEGVPA